MFLIYALIIIVLIVFVFTVLKADKLSVVYTTLVAALLICSSLNPYGFFALFQIIQILTFVLLAVHGYRQKELPNLNRFTIVFTAGLAVYAALSLLMVWPYLYSVKALSLLPIIPYTILIWHGKMGKNEFGYLTIINSASVASFFKLVVRTEEGAYTTLGILFFVMTIYLILGLILSTRKIFFKSNFFLFAFYVLVSAWLIYDPSASTYGKALTGYSIGALILIVHAFVLVIINLVYFYTNNLRGLN